MNVMVTSPVALVMRGAASSLPPETAVLLLKMEDLKETWGGASNRGDWFPEAHVVLIRLRTDNTVLALKLPPTF
jgi:hypothetical protein